MPNGKSLWLRFLNLQYDDGRIVGEGLAGLKVANGFDEATGDGLRLVVTAVTQRALQAIQTEPLTAGVARLEDTVGVENDQIAGTERYRALGERLIRNQVQRRRAGVFLDQLHQGASHDQRGRMTGGGI